MARLFNDANPDYVEASAAVVTAVPLTMACWAFPDDTTAVTTLMCLGNSAANANYFGMDIAGSVANDPFRVFVGAGAGTFINTLINTSGAHSGWNHYCGVWASATERRAYFNASNAGEMANTTSRTPSGVNRTAIGRLLYEGGSIINYMSGRIAEAAIWNVALTQAEISALAKGVSPALIRPASLVFYAPLVRDILDRKGNALTTSGTTVADHPRIILPRRRTIYLPASAAGETVVGAGLASETSEALGVSWSKRRAVGLASESDAALAATARRTIAAGLAGELDSALGVLPAKRLATGLASESDSALSATPRRTIAAGLATETDSAPALAAAKRQAIGIAVETDAAPGVTAQIGAAVGQAQETDEALAASAAKRKAAGVATEADTAPAVTARRTVAAGLATEIDTALAARVARAFAAGLAVETDAALALAWVKRKGIGLAVETDTALALVPIARPSTLPPRRLVSARPDRTLRSLRPDRTHVTRN